MAARPTSASTPTVHSSLLNVIVHDQDAPESRRDLGRKHKPAKRRPSK